MDAYFVRTIQRARAISLEAGQAKYITFFVNMTTYADFKGKVDAGLFDLGIDDCIVTK